jgi:hypothetical protein
MISRILFSQSESLSKRIELRKHQHTVDIEAFSIGYSYAYRISKSATIGVGVNLGFALHLFLNNPEYLEYFSGEYIGDSLVEQRYYKTRKKNFSLTAEYLKLRIVYRQFFLRNLYLDLGGYYSIGILPSVHGQSYFPLNSNIGFSASIFYGYDIIKIGHRIQAGIMHIDYYDGYSTNIKSIILTPIIIQLSLLNRK